METIKEIFARRLAATRLEQGMSQERLGALAGMGERSVGPIENRRRGTSLKNADALAAALQVRLAALVEDPPGSEDAIRLHDGPGPVWKLASSAHRRLFTKLNQWPAEKIERLERAIAAWERAPKKPRGRSKRRST